MYTCTHFSSLTLNAPHSISWFAQTFSPVCMMSSQERGTTWGDMGFKLDPTRFASATIAVPAYLAYHTLPLYVGRVYDARHKC